MIVLNCKNKITSPLSVFVTTTIPRQDRVLLHAIVFDRYHQVLSFWDVRCGRKNIKSGTYKVTAKFVGSLLQTKQVTITNGETAVLDFVLIVQYNLLNDVEISGYKRFGKKEVRNCAGLFHKPFQRELSHCLSV
jgi:hypothetical protein